MARSGITPTGKHPRLKTPPGACDSHVHFYNAMYPSAATALFTPPDAWIDEYRSLQNRLGLRRVVVVQPTTYGLDNACQLEAMKAFGHDARGVMVADRSTTDTELDRLTSLGVRGIFFLMLPGGVLPWDIVEEMAARVDNYGWHVQLQMNGRELTERLAMLKRLRGNLVIDHVGRFMGPVGADHPSFQALLELIDGGRCWVKLSAPYGSSEDGPPQYGDVAAEARALVRFAPQRMLWASNWPHPNVKPPPDDADLLDLLLDWVDDDATRGRILADNPAELYGF